MSHLDWTVYAEDYSESGQSSRFTYVAVRPLVTGFEVVHIDWHSYSPFTVSAFRALVELDFPTREAIASPFPLTSESIPALRETLTATKDK